jgi:3-oxoacyl-[acyl-carrier-protein] synthase II
MPVETPNPRSALVAEASVVCALGGGLNELWPRLCRGESAVAPVARFSTEAIAYHAAACLPDLDRDFDPALGRALELTRRCLRPLPSLPPDTRIIWAGVKDDVEYVERLDEGGPNPFFRHAPQYREWIAHELGLGGGGFEVNAACASSTAALALASQMIRSGRADNVLVCAADIVSRFTFLGFSALKALSPTRCRPFDEARDGLCLGDGAAAMLLSSPSALESRGGRPLARVLGWGIANDANHITGPARDGGGLIAAVRDALSEARLDPDAVEAFCAHGTGTPYNDAMELTALEGVFGPRRFPVFSIKGAVGHCLGAAGLIETAVCARALSERLVPPTAGLRLPEPRALGRVSDRPQAFGGRNILTSNSGFGGVNAALLLGGADA